MKKQVLTFLFSLALAQASFAQSSSVVRDYIARFRDVAIAEMQRTGVPAAITLAQGILETEAGKSDLVQRSNNHFGIKCKSDWKGETVSHDDDARGECFRKYNDPVESYKDHSDFLKNRPNYVSLFKINPADYEGWAYGLKKAGYATNPKYPQILIRLIKEYDLQQYTMMGLNGKPATDAPVVTVASTQSNEAKAGDTMLAKPASVEATYAAAAYIVHNVLPRETLYSIAKKYAVSVEEIMQWNNLPSQDLKVGQQIRINKK
ncbi:MAG: LysM peptidoglycan-binding protein [Flaviaesturariibacter sp.]|nr:LysM peptidoglycan-binding protein [Flaviaesturariibacter sp.]